MRPALAATAWIGSHARLVLAVGVALCFLAPGVSTAMRPALPVLVAVAFGLAMARIDLGEALRGCARPGEAARLALVVAVLIPGAAAAYLLLARALGLGPGLTAALVLLGAAPPIASSAGLCFLLGYDARRAVEVTVAATLLTPLIGPPVVAALSPIALGLDPLVLARKLGLIVAGGLAVAIGLQAGVGAGRINRAARSFDGISVLALVAVVLPLFDGAPELMRAEPLWALGVLVLGFAMNLGPNLLARLAFRAAGPRTAAAYGLLFGNRTIALYLAVLPFQPDIALFVALYQAPILLGPLLLKPIPYHTPN